MTGDRVLFREKNGLPCRLDEPVLDNDDIQELEFLIEKFTKRHNKLNTNKLYGQVSFFQTEGFRYVTCKDNKKCGRQRFFDSKKTIAVH